MVGKYEIIAHPVPYSAHMLRYTVFVDRKRIGSLLSVPTESDCKFLEKPPIVPPLKIFHLTNRPGRPKKGSTPPQPAVDVHHGISREEIPAGISIPAAGRSEDG